MDETDKIGDEKIWVGPHVVLFLDVLNQREAIRALEKLPSSPSEHAEYVRALKDSKGKVEGLRKILRGFYSAYENPPPQPLMGRLNPQQRKFFDEWKARKMPLAFQSFADTVVAFAMVKAHDGMLPVDSLYALLSAAGGVLMTCLAAGVPVRGGIDMNVALVLDGNDLYGPAALEAFRLESEVAQYPRVAVGKNVLGFLQAIRATTENDLLSQMNRELAGVCMNLISVAEDAVPFVDFLGDTFRGVVGETGNDLFLNGFNFAKREHETFLKSGNQKLAGRYASLRRYYELNANAWSSQKS